MKVLSLLLCVMLVAAMAFAQAPGADDLAKGDEAQAKFDNTLALKHYQMAYKADTTNCTAIWKVSRTHVDLGEVAVKDVQRNNYYEGEKFARKAIKQCPNDPMAHLALAIAVGRVALMEGGKKKVELSKEVKTEAEKTIALDANNDIAYHVLARWNREVANLSGILKMFAKVLYGGLPPASNDKAIELFSKAIALHPGYCNHYLELGITYEELGKYPEAKAQYELALSAPIKAFNDETHKKEAQERLSKVTKKIKS